MDNGVELLVRRAKNDIRVVLASDRLVGGDLHHRKAVEVMKLPFSALSGSGHSGLAIVSVEQFWQGDAGGGPTLAANLHAFLGFQGLMKAVAEALPL